MVFFLLQGTLTYIIINFQDENVNGTLLFTANTQKDKKYVI